MQNLRQQLAQRRKSIPPQQRQHAEQQVAKRLHRLIEAYTFQRIGVYFAIGSELSITPLFNKLWQQKKQLYLPVIDTPESGHMRFAQFTEQQQLIKGKFGLSQPVKNEAIIDSRELDLCCVPLLGFNGNYRIGWGKGYYDRCFARRNTRLLNEQPSDMRPLLVGLAFSQQFDARIQPQPWDIAVDYLLTETYCNDAKH